MPATPTITVVAAQSSPRTARPSKKARRRRQRPAAAACAAAACAAALATLLALVALPRAALASPVSTALEAILRLPPVPLTTAAAVLGVDASTQPNGVGPTWRRALNDVVAPPSGSPASVVRARVWTNATSPGFLYPEQDPSPENEFFIPSLLDKPNFGVCMSGGGLRAAILMLGYGRVLWREGLWQKMRYAGGSSGSAWFLAAVSYANATRVVDGGDGDDDSSNGNRTRNNDNSNSNSDSGKGAPRSFDGEAFFGRYLPPERLTDAAARAELGAWGRAVADATLAPHSAWSGPAYRRRALTWWTDATADLFLRPFGLSDLGSGTGALGTRGRVAERVAAVLARARRASVAAEAARRADGLEGNARAVAGLRDRVAAAAGEKAGDKAAAVAAAALRELGGVDATDAEARWAEAAKLGVRRVLPPSPAGSPPPVYMACTQDRPFPLISGSILSPRGASLFYPFEMTPMYVGAPGAHADASSPVGALGGGMVESIAWNSRLTPEQSAAAVAAVRRSAAAGGKGGAGGGAGAAGNDSSNSSGRHTTAQVDATVDYFVPLAGQVGVSSAFMAQGFRPASSLLKQVGAVDHFAYWNLLDFSRSAQVEFADGGGADVLGIYGQLRRGVRALLVLHATFQEPTGAAGEFALAGGYEVSSLFGVVPRGSTRFSGTDEARQAASSQVFETGEWPPLYRELRARFYAGEPPVIRRKALRVLPNAFQAVRGGYDADVLFVFNVRTAGWEERLPLATRLELERGRGDANSPMGGYPVVPTGLARAGAGLTGLLSQQASWTMTHALPVLKQMLADLPPGERGVGRFATTPEEAARAPAEAAAAAVGLAVGQAPAADVDRADAGLGALGERAVDAALGLLPPPRIGGGGGGGGRAPSPPGATALTAAPPRGPGAAAVVGNARVMAELAGAPAEGGVGIALAALKAASSPLLVDGRPPTRRESRAAALAANDPRPAHERFLSRQYTRAQALGAAVGGLRTQVIAATAGKLVSGVEDALGPPVSRAVREVAAAVAPVQGPLLRAAAAALAAGDMHGANEA